MKTIEQAVELVQCTPEPAKLIERIARVCYNSEDKMACDCATGDCPKCVARRDKFLGGLAKRGHDSVFEHAAATFRIVTDRGITHELVRHRLASFTQSSTRYINYADDVQVISPLTDDPAKLAAWRAGVEAAERQYREMLQAGASPQEARDVLPTCAAAVIFVTANFREWRHIIRLRIAGGAHPKIRVVAEAIKAELARVCPVYFADLA